MTPKGDFEVSEDGIARAVIQKSTSGVQAVVYYKWHNKHLPMPEVFFVETGKVNASSVYRLNLEPNGMPTGGVEGLR